MLQLLIWVASLVLSTGGGGEAPPATADEGTAVIPFRLEAAPRVDPVFGDVNLYRAAVDRFFALHTEMQRVGDEFSGAVHATLAPLQAAPSSKPAKGARTCPPAAATPYGRALQSGSRYLQLGRALEAKYRDIKRSDDLGETAGLTPDYRFKVKRVRDLFQEMLREYREMRIAFYDQLGTELKFAGCDLATLAPPQLAANASGPDSGAAPNPSDPAAWTLEDAPAPSAAPLPDEGLQAGARGDAAASGPTPAASAAALPIWIEIDNSACAEPARLVIDGLQVGEIGGKKRLSVRTRSGPHELCILSASDKRTCGAPGTRRKAYLHDGWGISVHCER